MSVTQMQFYIGNSKLHLLTLARIVGLCLNEEDYI